MSLATIRTNIKTVVEGVTGIGTVHDYVRHWAGDTGKFQDAFKTSTDKIIAWQITRKDTEETSHNQNNRNLRRHTINIFGIYGVNDDNATEKTFQDLIETLCASLRTSAKQPSPLSGAALRVGWPQVRTVEHRMFKNILCHSCDIEFWVDEYITF